MAYLIERKTQTLYVTASSVSENGKMRKIVVESRPEFAIVRLAGARGEFPISWKMIYEAAMRHHAENLRLEAEAEKSHSRRKRKPDL
jgi:DNA-dependent RNA polymerase auxiliary subunit epsilon